jgi:hypothetical protein
MMAVIREDIKPVFTRFLSVNMFAKVSQEIPGKWCLTKRCHKVDIDGG